MSLSARFAVFIFIFPLASLLAQTGTLPPALADLRAKADSGDAVAQYNLGVAYAQGREISADPIEAYVWLSLAAEHGTPGKAYETLLQEITPAQLAEGKRRLNLRKNAITAVAASPITLAPLETPDRATELAAKNQQLTAEIATLRTQLAAANDNAGRALVSAKADTNAVTDALNAKLTALNTQLTAARSESAQALATAKSTAEAAQTEAAQQKRALTETVAALTAEKNALAVKLAQASTPPAPQPDLAAPKIAALETELAQVKANLSGAQTKLSAAAALEADLARAQQQASAAQTQLASLTADRDALKQQLAEANRAPAPKPADDSAPKIAALTTQVTSLTAAKSALEQKLASAEARLIAPPPPVASAPVAPAKNEELTAANTKLEATQRSFTAAQNENAQLKAAADAAKSENATLRQQLADARTKAAAPVAPAKNEELTAANSKLEATQRSFTAAQNENAQLKAAADAAKSETATLRQQLADARTKATAPAAPAKSEELTAANAKLETVLRSFSLAQGENAQLKSTAEAAQTENAALRQQLAEAQSKLSPMSAATSAIDPVALQKQLQDTETKLNVALRSFVVLSAENDKLKSEVGARSDSASQAVAAVEARANAANATQAAELAGIRDQLRQVQAQSAAYAEENFQLRTRLASGGNTAASPTRSSDRLVATPVPPSDLVAPATVAAVANPRTHTVVAGDTLLGLAKRYYGQAGRWTDILAANDDVLGGKPTLLIGRTLRIP